MVLGVNTKYFNIKYIIFAIILCCNDVAVGQNIEQDVYNRYLDSADYYFTEEPKLAKQYLDSISEPLKKHIDGRLSEYYQILAIINGKFNEQAELYQNYLLAIKYAEKEKNYDVAGMASLELFYNIYIVKKDSTAFKYLDKAKTYFTKSENKNGLIEVLQMPAFIELNNKNYAESNALLLEHLETYKQVEDDAYYYLYALFMLVSNHIHLNDFDSAHYYFNQLKALEGNETLTKNLIDIHKVTLYGCFAEEFLEQKQMDSTLVYLKKAAKLKGAMNASDMRHHFKLYIDYYDATNAVDLKSAYVDSLRVYEEGITSKNLEASLKINKTLFQTESALKHETHKKYVNRYVIGILLLCLLSLITFVILKYKKIKQLLSEYTKRDHEYSYLKDTHEKLKVKVHGLEEYIIEVKKKVKEIATINDINKQKSEIKALYKNVHLNSSTLLDKSENHLELISALNVDFFNTINKNYPLLSPSEVIICYYIHTGFKNKEIAAFLNTSIRAVESKRYRISKKLELQNSDMSLLDVLQNM